MATMRLRCIHSCMVLTVVGLLLVYSAFLTSPSFDDTNGDGGDTTGSSSSLPWSQSLARLGGPQAFSGLINVTLSSSSVLGLTAGTAVQTQTAFAPSGQPLLGPGRKAEVGEGPNSFPLGHQTADLVNPTLQGQNEVGKAAATPPLGAKTPRTQRNPPSSNHPVWTKDIYESGFSFPNPQLCPNDGSDIRLIVLITSAPGHFSARDAIRLTWGHYAQRLDVSMAFLLGKTENETILDGIETEKHLYDDLIVANFEDSYDNLTLKTMSSLEWIDSFCNQSDYVLKTDDDMFINVPNLLNFIDRIEDEDKKQPKLYGRLARKWKPVRNKKSKYYISWQQFRKTVYPDFTTGPAYLFSSRIARPLFDKGMEKTYLKLEDVYTTGIVAQELGIKRMNIADFANKKVNFHKTGFCALAKLISMHMVAFHEQFELWKKILDGRTKCKVIYTNVKSKEPNKDNSSSTNPVNSKPMSNPKENSQSSNNNNNNNNNIISSNSLNSPSVGAATFKTSAVKK